MASEEMRPSVSTPARNAILSVTIHVWELGGADPSCVAD